eukprot:sb/3465554/
MAKKRFKVSWKGRPGESKRLQPIEWENDDFGELLGLLKGKIRQKYQIDAEREFSLSYQPESTIHQHEDLTALDDAEDMMDVWEEEGDQRIFIKFIEDPFSQSGRSSVLSSLSSTDATGRNSPFRPIENPQSSSFSPVIPANRVATQHPVQPSPHPTPQLAGANPVQHRPQPTPQLAGAQPTSRPAQPSQNLHGVPTPQPVEPNAESFSDISEKEIGSEKEETDGKFLDDDDIISGQAEEIGEGSMKNTVEARKTQFASPDKMSVVEVKETPREEPDHNEWVEVVGRGMQYKMTQVTFVVFAKVNDDVCIDFGAGRVYLTKSTLNRGVSFYSRTFPLAVSFPLEYRFFIFNKFLPDKSEIIRTSGHKTTNSRRIRVPEGRFLPELSLII